MEENSIVREEDMSVEEQTRYIDNLETVPSVSSTENTTEINVGNIPIPEPIQNPSPTVEEASSTSDTPDSVEATTTTNTEETVTEIKKFNFDIKEETHARFAGAQWYRRAATFEVSIIGAGGIGSWTALLISRIGVKCITIYDSDKVEYSNLSGQLYMYQDVGQPKVTSVANTICNFSPSSRVISYNSQFTNGIVSSITITAVDNMSARKAVYMKWCRGFKGVKPALFIDGRLAADELQIFTIRGDQFDRMKVYEDKWLFSDSEAEETPCSFKQTSYMAAMIGSLITNIVVNHFASLATNTDGFYDLPFFVNYTSDTIYLKAPNTY